MGRNESILVGLTVLLIAALVVVAISDQRKCRESVGGNCHPQAHVEIVNGLVICRCGAQ